VPGPRCRGRRGSSPGDHQADRRADRSDRRPWHQGRPGRACKLANPAGPPGLHLPVSLPGGTWSCGNPIVAGLKRPDGWRGRGRALGHRVWDRPGQAHV